MGRFEPLAVWTVFWRTIARHYYAPNRRVSRTEFWYFVLGAIAASFLVAIVSGLADLSLPSLIVGLALLPPLAGMGSGRLRDTGHNGLLVWTLVLPLLLMHLFWVGFVFSPFNPLNLLWITTGLATITKTIALIAFVALVYFWVLPGTPGDNRYGASPDGIGAEPAAA
ncbi:MAG TPA: DUF805 domain-containing protein [Rhizomicrobium sp.]|jgi:uncharacterized membrane protein YhaH (DUF805 family)